MSTDTPPNSARYTDTRSLTLPERSDVKTGVMDAREIGREIVNNKRYDTAAWGYANPEVLINRIGEVLGSLAAKLLDEGKPTQEVRATLRKVTSERLSSVHTAVHLIGIAVGVFRSANGALAAVEVRTDGGGLRINNTTDTEIGLVVRALHNDVVERIISHGGSLSPEDIFHSVRAVLAGQSS